jgi:mannose-6-phosphate isomerase-like protein (cupin superfamily)
MLKVNTKDIEEDTWVSPKGKFSGAGKAVSEALGRKPASTDLDERHPFDVEILRISPGKSPYPYHAHSAQWEFYHVISGTGVVRHDKGTTAIEAGDAFIFRPDEAHQFTSDGAQDLVIYVIADNPIGETAFYPDSNKASVRTPKRMIVRAEPLDYFDGEE